MHVFCPGDAFGSLLMGTVDRQLPYAEAVDDVVVCNVDETGFKRLLQRCPNTCFGLFGYLAQHHTEDMRRIEQLLHSRCQNRVLYALRLDRIRGSSLGTPTSSGAAGHRLRIGSAPGCHSPADFLYAGARGR